MLERVRWWWRRRTLRPSALSRVRSRVRLPLYREIEPDTLARLWAVRPEFDLYVRPDQMVWLLEHQPGRLHVHEARRTMERGGVQRAQTLLMADGWRCLAELPPWALAVPELIVRRARLVVNCTDTEVERAFEAALEIADGRAYEREAVRIVRERVRADARSDHRILIRRRVSIIKPRLQGV